MQTLEKSKATQTTTSNQFRSSKSVKWTAELFEFQRVNFATENLTYANTTEVSRETTSNQQSISNARCAEDDYKILIEEIAYTKHRADKTHHTEIKLGADCQKQQRS